ncbi:MAG: hypothetical protein QNJ94_07570, partial [Alphaproteobacteria bacterium]|nr:hypothetical protein [Alphaproteobacteria bacterium]
MARRREREAEDIRRIILALDPSEDSRDMLEAAASLAARLRAEIDAVFLEDENLLRSAELPFVRRINLLSAAA